MAEIVPLVDYIARKRLASPLSFAAGGNIYNAVSQGGVGNAADTLEAMLFGVEVLPEAFEQVTVFAFGSIAPISPPVLGVAKNARLYWGATVLADFQAAEQVSIFFRKDEIPKVRIRVFDVTNRTHFHRLSPTRGAGTTSLS